MDHRSGAGHEDNIGDLIDFLRERQAPGLLFIELREAEILSALRDEGMDVSHIHLRHIWPMPKNLGQLLGGFKQVLVPEMNNGQLVTLLRAQYLVDAQGLNKVSGQPFKIAEIEAAIRDRLEI